MPTGILIGGIGFQSRYRYLSIVSAFGQWFNYFLTDFNYLGQLCGTMVTYHCPIPNDTNLLYDTSSIRSWILNTINESRSCLPIVCGNGDRFTESVNTVQANKIKSPISGLRPRRLRPALVDIFRFLLFGYGTMSNCSQNCLDQLEFCHIFTQGHERLPELYGLSCLSHHTLCMGNLVWFQ